VSHLFPPSHSHAPVPDPAADADARRDKGHRPWQPSRADRPRRRPVQSDLTDGPRNQTMQTARADRPRRRPVQTDHADGPRRLSSPTDRVDRMPSAVTLPTFSQPSPSHPDPRSPDAVDEADHDLSPHRSLTHPLALKPWC
jgi:hypothetical protein